MPENSPETVADRAQGTLTNVHPRADGSIIPTPDDVMEGRGDFTSVDRDGNPTGLRIGHVENPDGWDALVGDSPSTTTQQNAGALPISRPSYVHDTPDVVGPPAPSPNDPLLAKIPRPETPILKALKVAVAGYPATTATSPLWYAYAWINKSGLRTPLSPSVPFQLAQGQGVRVSWGDPPPLAVGVALFLSIPGTSTVSASGPMYEQRRLLFSTYHLSYYDLLGPYRTNAWPAPAANETTVPNPTSIPGVTFASGAWMIGGDYHFYWTAVDEAGNETLPSPAQHIVLPFYFPGRHFSCKRGPLPPRAAGWYMYMQKHETEAEGGKDAMGRLYWRSSAGGHSAGEGKDFPISRSHEEIPTTGDVTPGFGAYDVDVSSDALPTENTTGMDAPDAAPDTPLAFGASRPAGGLKYARVVERVGSRRSVASNLASINLAFDEVLRVIHREHTNLLSNGDYLELDNNNAPLDHTITTTGGFAYGSNRQLVIGTTGAQTGTTPSDVFDPVTMDRTVEGSVWAYSQVRDPQSGTLAGNLEVVLRQVDAAGTTTDTVLATHSAVGDYEDYITINPTGGGGTAWRSDMVQAGLVIRFSGATKNMLAYVMRANMRDHKHKFRWEIEAPDTLPSRPPGSKSNISPTLLAVAPPPQTFPYPEPDRFKATGTLREAVTFEGGTVPAGWTTTTTGGATLTVDAAAALVGSFGLHIQDTTTAALSSGVIAKTFDPAGSYNMGFHRKVRPAGLPAGKIVLGGLARPSDGALFAWFESGSIVEIQTLDIDASPVSPGTFTIIPDGTSTSVAVVATKQVETLSISAAPTTPSTVTITLGGKKYLIPTGGSYESAQLTLQKPRYNGYLTIGVGGVSHNITVSKTDTANTAAAKVAAHNFGTGWTVSRRNNVLTFTATTPGPLTNATYARGTSGTPGTMVTLEEGTSETAADLADRIAAASYSPDWTLAHTPGSTTLVWTATQAGLKTSATVSWGSSGAAGTMSTTTAGAVDTPAALAARIRTAGATGYTLSGTGSQVIVTANTAGFRAPLRADPGATGTKYHTATTQDGKNADLWAYAKDDSGTVYSRQIMAGLSTTTIYNIEAAIDGAGTDHAAISFWGSIGAAAKTLLYRLSNVSMVNYPAGRVIAGVSAEGVATETWNIHIDDIRVTDYGDSYYVRTNAYGELIGQFHHYGLPTQPVRQDIGLQDWYEPCLPGVQYAISAQMRYDNVPAAIPAKPVFITAHKDNGDVLLIGDVTGDTGISGTAAWFETTPRLVTPPADCYFLGFHSKDLSSGEIVVQRVVMSPGTTAKRTGAYATSGTYDTVLEASTPYQPGIAVSTPGIRTFWHHVRRDLDAFADTPTGSTATVQYRSAATLAGLSGATWQTNPALVPDLEFVEVQVAFTSGGTRTTIPVLISGRPRLVYDLVLTDDPLATLLRANRTELAGGAFFAAIGESEDAPEVVMNVLPGLKLQPQILSEQAPTLPESSAYVFTNDAREEIVNNWYEPRVVETDGEALTVRLSAKPSFKRLEGAPVYNDPSDGKKYSVWAGTLAWGEIISRVPLV